MKNMNLADYFANKVKGKAQTNEFAKNILHTNIIHLKASVDPKISTSFEKKWGGVRLWITKWTFKLSCTVSETEYRDSHRAKGCRIQQTKSGTDLFHRCLLSYTM